jgi:hypothetical protein
LIRVWTAFAPIPHFSASVMLSAIVSITPRIIELPISLNVGAVSPPSVPTKSRKRRTGTLFDVSTQIDDLASDSRYKNVCRFLLREVFSAHENNEQGFVGSGRCPEDWASDEASIGYASNELVEFAYGW